LSLVASAPSSLRTEWPQQNDFQVACQDEHFADVDELKNKGVRTAL
jgi:hypothetical protein